MTFFKLILIIFQSISVFTNLFGLPGNLLSLIFPVTAYFLHWIDLKVLILIIVLIVIGEIFEFLTGYFATKRVSLQKGTFTISIIFGFILSILMAPVFFGLGALIGAFLGAFLGALIYEFLRHGDFKTAMENAIAVFKGRVLGTLLKFVFGISAVVINGASIF